MYQSKEMLRADKNELLQAVSCASHPTCKAMSSEEEHEPVGPNIEFPYCKLPRLAAMQFSSPSSISPEMSTADFSASVERKRR